MRTTASTVIDKDRYELTPLAAHPHGFAIYQRLHGHLGRALGEFKGELGIAAAVGALVSDEAFSADLDLMISGGGLRCNNQEVGDWKAHLYDSGKMDQLYELALFAVKTNYGAVFPALLGKLQRLAKEKGQSGGLFGTLQTSILSALGSSGEGTPPSGS